jgi:hypothetical protein
LSKPKNTDGTIDELGVLITAAYGLDTSWMQKGSCFGWGSQRPEQPTPWQVAPGRTYNGLSGNELVRYALLLCASCDAQYDCATYAVQATMIAGTWSMPITQLRWLQSQDDALDLIDLARDNEMPVQVVASQVLAARKADT